jgi:hypothetical protein
MIKFQIETFNDYLNNTIAEIENDRIVDYAISTMNLFARPDSLIDRFLDCLLSKNFKVHYDKKLTERTYVLPDGHYVFKILPRGRQSNRHERISDEISASTKRKLAAILVNLQPRFFQIKSRSGWWKKLLSLHLLQFLEASHLKVSVSLRRDHSKSIMITSGELSSEGQQNNLALSLQSAKAYDFAQKLLDPDYQVGQKLHETCQISPRLQLVADYGNYGAPSVKPQIHQLALKMISDQPQDILLLSQYNPSGRILRALNRAAVTGVHVIIPLQPANDYRRKYGGFKLLFAKFNATVNRQIHLPTRPKPSHVKCLIVQHRDGDLSMIFGSDNLESWAENFYRNTEIAAVIQRAKPGENEYKIIQTMLDALVKTQEISQPERDRYRAN